MYNIHLPRQYHDWVERRQLLHEIRQTIRDIYSEHYRTMRQAEQMLANLAHLIQRAQEFNERAPIKPIDVPELLRLDASLESQVESVFLQGQLPLE